MPIDRDRDNKLRPTDNEKHSDPNKLPDESDMSDHTAFSDCSSEDGSSSKQSINSVDNSVDSGHDSDCMSKLSTLSDVTSIQLSSENDNTSDSSLSSDSEHPLNTLSSHDSDYVSITSDLSDTTSLHYSPKRDSIFKNSTRHFRGDETKNKSSFTADNSIEKTKKVQKAKVIRNFDKQEKFTIPQFKRFQKEVPSTETIKQTFSKCSKPNADYTDDMVNALLDPVEYLVKELEAKLKLAATSDTAELIAAIKGCLKYLKSELAASHLADDQANNVIKNLLEMTLSSVKNTTLEKEIKKSIYGIAKTMDESQFEPGIVSDTNHYQSSDDQYSEYVYDSLMDKTEKYKSTLKRIEDCKRFQNQMDGQDVTVMFSFNEGSDENGNEDENQDGNQGDQADNQGNGANVPADIVGQEAHAQGSPQAAELPEDMDTSSHQPFYQVQEYSSLLAIQEEEIRGKMEMVLQSPELFKLPERSELVTVSSHPYHTAYHVEDQHVTSVETQYQQFSKTLATKGISVEAIMKFIHISAGHVPILYNCITDLLSPIVVVTDEAEQVFKTENICKCLPTVIELVLMMLNNRPIPVTETGGDFPFATSDSYWHNRPHDGGVRYFPSETICTSTTLLDQPVDAPNNFQVTTNPLQDTDNDVGDVGVDDIRRIMYEYRHSAEACYVIEAEAFQLLGHCCRMCGIAMCQGERIAMEMRSSLHNARRCICVLQRNELLARLTTSVNFNTCQNCIPGILRTYVPHEILQRNVALSCLGLQAFATGRQVFDTSHNLKCAAINPMALRAQCSINSSINLHCRNPSSFLYGCLSNIPTSLITSEGPISLVNVQNLIDRLCSNFSSLLLSNHSMLQPVIQATSGYLSACNEYIQRFLSSLPHDVLHNTSSKLTISMTVVPDGVPIDMDQLSDGLLNCRMALRYQDSITSSLHLPPINAFNNIPIIVNWTVTVQSSSLSFLQVGSESFDGVESIDPVEAVNQHGRDSLVVALQPTYGHHGDEENNNSIQDINGLVENPISDPNDWHKTNRLDIYGYFPAENSSYEHHPSDNDTIANDNQVNCETEKATISDDSSKSEAKK